MKGFLSDNSSGVDVRIMEALAKANFEHNYPYGEDPWTKRLEGIIKEQFGSSACVTSVFNGTGANVLGIISGLRSYECVLAVESSHINVDECGALEKLSGAKIITVPAVNGKLAIELLDEKLKVKDNFHHNQPKLISISQLTELGTCYTLEEIRKIADFAHQNGMLLHVDGARIANACCVLNVSLREMITDTGVDILSLGGTKNGLMFGELIITFNERTKYELGFYRKQMMQLASKMRFISTQFIAYLEENVFTDNAKHSNAMAKYIYEGLSDVEGVEFIAPVEGNMMFLRLTDEKLNRMKESFHFYTMSDNIIRVVTSFDTTLEECRAFVEKCRSVGL